VFSGIIPLNKPSQHACISYFQLGVGLKNSQQVSPYFLYDLDKIRVFIELSDRPCKEDATKHNESDLETYEATVGIGTNTVVI
tara:strand:+ start:377 stop:625 length:249 start_codon:yes stop_codon:yes gene_type:complete